MTGHEYPSRFACAGIGLLALVARRLDGAEMVWHYLRFVEGWQRVESG